MTLPHCVSWTRRSGRKNGRSQVNYTCSPPLSRPKSEGTTETDFRRRRYLVRRFFSFCRFARNSTAAARLSFQTASQSLRFPHHEVTWLRRNRRRRSNRNVFPNTCIDCITRKYTTTTTPPPRRSRILSQDVRPTSGPRRDSAVICRTGFVSRRLPCTRTR